MITSKDIHLDGKTINARDYLFPMWSSAYRYMVHIMKYNKLSIDDYNKFLLFNHFFYPVIKHAGRDNHEVECVGYRLNPWCCDESIDYCLKNQLEEHQ